MDVTLYLGIDGGGSGCRARLADASGHVLGEGVESAPTNLTTDTERARQSVVAAAGAALKAAGLSPDAITSLHAGIGVAGADAGRDRVAGFLASLPFATSRVRNDAEVACLGAHAGSDGAILILGTGSHGLLIRDGVVHRVGGWGFLLSDGGSGAVLGHRAARHALAAHEGLADASPFTQRVMARFDGDPAQMLEWALAAVPRDWATLAPLVFEFAAAGDLIAAVLLAAATREVVALLDRLIALGATRIALLGGLSAVYRPSLPARYAARLVAPLGDALDGALRLARG